MKTKEQILANVVDVDVKSIKEHPTCTVDITEALKAMEEYKLQNKEQSICNGCGATRFRDKNIIILCNSCLIDFKASEFYCRH